VNFEIKKWAIVMAIVVLVLLPFWGSIAQGQIWAGRGILNKDTDGWVSKTEHLHTVTATPTHVSFYVNDEQITLKSGQTWSSPTGVAITAVEPFEYNGELSWIVQYVGSGHLYMITWYEPHAIEVKLPEPGDIVMVYYLKNGTSVIEPLKPLVPIEYPPMEYIVTYEGKQGEYYIFLITAKMGGTQIGIRHLQIQIKDGTSYFFVSFPQRVHMVKMGVKDGVFHYGDIGVDDLLTTEIGTYYVHIEDMVDWKGRPPWSYPSDISEWVPMV